MDRNFDYSVYEGKEIKAVSKRQDDLITDRVVVAGCEYDIGITLVDANDKRRHICCLVNPNTVKGFDVIGDYDKIFDMIVSFIRDGVLDVDCLYKNVTLNDGYGIDDIENGPIDSNNCAFSQ